MATAGLFILLAVALMFIHEGKCKPPLPFSPALSSPSLSIFSGWTQNEKLTIIEQMLAKKWKAKKGMSLLQHDQHKNKVLPYATHPQGHLAKKFNPLMGNIPPNVQPKTGNFKSKFNIPMGILIPKLKLPHGNMPPKAQKLNGNMLPKAHNQNGDIPPKAHGQNGNMPPKAQKLNGNMPPKAQNKNGNMPPKAQNQNGNMPPKAHKLNGNMPPKAQNQNGNMPPKAHKLNGNMPPKAQNQNGNMPPHKEATPSSPWFCHNLGCPHFTTLEPKGKDYEVREYDASNWFSTSLQGVNLKEAEQQMFDKLFNYIDGENVDDEKIAMTSPVLIRFEPGPGPTCEDDFTMSFFNAKLPHPPAPTEEDVFFSALPKQKVFVSSFSGYADKDLWLECAKNLTTTLTKAGEKFRADYFFAAGYDSPFHIIHRHNEVWFIEGEN